MRRLARSGGWYREPIEVRGPGWVSVGGAVPFRGVLPRRLVLTANGREVPVWLADVARLPRSVWRFLWNPAARHRRDAWPFDVEGATFFDGASEAAPDTELRPEAPLENEGAARTAAPKQIAEVAR